MPTPTRLPVGDELLNAVTAAMTALHKRYYGRRPITAKSRLMGDDVLVCVMGGVYTEVEKTLIEIQRSAVVQENRSAFQQTMQHRFIDEIQRLTGRRVIAFISNHHIGPDIEIEIFVLTPPDSERSQDNLEEIE